MDRLSKIANTVSSVMDELKKHEVHGWSIDHDYCEDFYITKKNGVQEAHVKKGFDITTIKIIHNINK